MNSTRPRTIHWREICVLMSEILEKYSVKIPKYAKTLNSEHSK